MNLSPGTFLGHYEIRSLLGAGGMGEVYRAWDGRLRREVAVKVLLPGADAARVQRFEHEARAAGALNHPNITAVYDVGSHDGTPYFVAERLEGETLRTRIESGSITPTKAIEYAIQIARGLSAAHERGIVHRDLKPENVFVCGDEVVKILDFGVAKLRRVDGNSGTVETLTLDRPAIAGTAAYMSPEQIRAEPVDARTDIFALGVVIYEMLTGTRPFSGPTVAELHTAILREEPEPLPERLRGVDRLIRRCLEKRPEDRFDSARDVAHALEAVSVTTGSPARAKLLSRIRLGAAPVIAAAMVAGALIGAIVMATVRSAPQLPRYTQLTFRNGIVSGARFAPDGETIVYSATSGGEPVRVFTTRLGSTESRDLGIEGHVLSVSSAGDVAFRLPSSAWPATPGLLSRVSLAGGAPRELLDDVDGASWDPDGRDIAVVRRDNGRGVIEYPPGRIAYRSPGIILAMCMLPDRRFAVFERLRDGSARPCALSLVESDGSRKVLSAGWTGGVSAPIVWSPATREILFAAWTDGDAALHAATPSGRTRMVARIPGDFHVRDVDRSGRMLLYRNLERWGVLAQTADDDEEHDLGWLNYSSAADISPDGKYLLLGNVSGGVSGGGIALRKTDGTAPVELARGTPLALSPDAKRVMALPSAAASDDTLLIIPSGAGQRRELRHASIPRFFNGAWFADGQRIVISGGPEYTRARLYVWDVENKTTPRAISPEGRYGRLTVSPDGRMIAARRWDGPLSLYPTDGGAPQPVRGGRIDDDPLRWSTDGLFLFVRTALSLPAVVEQVEIATGSRSTWKELMPADRTGLYEIHSVTITPDGKSYAYTPGFSVGTLYLVEGLK